MLETIARRWSNTVIVAATGPSLTEDVAELCRDHRAIIAVNDAYKRLPFAPVMYACDAAWWRAHKGCPDFRGEKWSTHNPSGNDKREAARLYGVRLVAGKKAAGFSTDPAVIHYGNNSGFQAVNLAILFGAKRVVLVGFNMRREGNQEHFFGSHPAPLRRASSFGQFIAAFNEAAKQMPRGVEIINATSGSALGCFPYMPLQEALDGFGALRQVA
jgi:hypothetical protein